MNHSRLRRRFLAAARYESRCRSLNADPMLRPMGRMWRPSALDRIECIITFDGRGASRFGWPWDPTIDRRLVGWPAEKVM